MRGHQAICVIGPLAAILVGVVGVHAQVASTTSAEARLQFDVAVVKANHSSDAATSRFPLGIGDAFTPGGAFIATNQSLLTYLRFAFKLADFQGLPSWVGVERFDIQARADATSSKDDMRVMMQALLRERFGLRMHTEQRMTEGLALRVSGRTALGPSLRAANPANCTSTTQVSQGLIICGRIGPGTADEPRHLRISGRSIPLSRFATFMTNPATGIDRPVFDQTGLTGLFDLDIEWTGDRESGSSDSTTSAAGDLTFAQALHDQLGLKLVRSKGTIGVLHIDRIQRPIAD